MDNVWKLISEHRQDGELVLTLRLVSKGIHAAVMLGTGGKTITTAIVDGDVASLLSATSKSLIDPDDMQLVFIVWDHVLNIPINAMRRLAVHNFVMMVYITNAAEYLLLEVDQAYDSVMQYVRNVWRMCAETDNVEVVQLKFISEYTFADSELDELVKACIEYGSREVFAHLRRKREFDDDDLMDMIADMLHAYCNDGDSADRNILLIMIRDIVDDHPSIQQHTDWTDDYPISTLYDGSLDM